MIRKFVIAAVAVAALGAGALSVTATPASAKKWGKWHHHNHYGHVWGGLRFYAPGFFYVGSCVRQVWVTTPSGKEVPATINICD